MHAKVRKEKFRLYDFQSAIKKKKCRGTVNDIFGNIYPFFVNTCLFVNLYIFWKYSTKMINYILSPKLFLPIVRKNCSSDREKLLKFEAEGREFAKFLRSVEQFIQTVKVQNNFW